MTASSSWGVLVAQRQKALAVGEALVAKNIDHFIPLLETQTFIRGRYIRGVVPLLGDYVLMEIPASWYSLLRLKIVKGILLNESDNPARVLPHELERLRALCVNRIYKPRKMHSQRTFMYGDRVTPKEGPLAYHVGKFDKSSKRSESALFVLFGREQRVTFKAGELIAA